MINRIALVLLFGVLSRSLYFSHLQYRGSRCTKFIKYLNNNLKQFRVDPNPQTEDFIFAFLCLCYSSLIILLVIYKTLTLTPNYITVEQNVSYALTSPPCVSSASNHLNQQQTISKTSRSPHGSTSKVSQLHLPALPNRHGIKHMSVSVSRANRDNAPRQVPPSGRGGGTGRREAVAITRQNPRSDARAYGRSSITTSREFVASHVTVSKVSHRYYYSGYVS